METDRAAFRGKTEELVEKMTVEEMMGQLCFDAPALPRLGIPSCNWWNEGLHGTARGTASVFPRAIGLATAFDADLLKNVAGSFSPSGKLPVTFYSRKKPLPDFTDYAMEGRTYRYIREEAVRPWKRYRSTAGPRLPISPSTLCSAASKRCFWRAADPKRL